MEDRTESEVFLIIPLGSCAVFHGRFPGCHNQGTPFEVRMSTTAT